MYIFLIQVVLYQFSLDKLQSCNTVHCVPWVCWWRITLISLKSTYLSCFSVVLSAPTRQHVSSIVSSVDNSCNNFSLCLYWWHFVMTFVLPNCNTNLWNSWALVWTELLIGPAMYNCVFLTMHADSTQMFSWIWCYIFSCEFSCELWVYYRPRLNPYDEVLSSGPTPECRDHRLCWPCKVQV